MGSAVTVLGKQFKAQTEFFFTALAAPYFTNVVPDDPTKPAELNVPWLSEDLRVFTATPGAPPGAQNQHQFPSGPQFVENSSSGAFDVNGAYACIQALLQYLNQNYGNPAGTGPFAPGSLLSFPQQQGEFTADSSVAPFFDHWREKRTTIIALPLPECG